MPAGKMTRVFKARQGQSKITLSSPAFKRAVRKIAEKTRIEKHYYSDYNTAAECLIGGTFINLSPTAQGNTDSTRTGDIIEGDALQMTYAIGRKSGGTASTYYVRVLFFIWHMDNGAEAPSLTDLMYDPTNLPYFTQYEPDGNKFKILYDKIHPIAKYDIVGSNIVRKVNVKLGGVKMRYMGAGTTGTNQLYMLIIGNDVTGVTTANIAYYYKFLFRD